MMQEVFLRVYDKHSTFSNEVPILHWIYRITTNVCLKRLRRRSSHPVVDDPAAVSALVDHNGDLADRHAVRQVLAGLDGLTQRVVVHYYLDGMKMEEVAAAVGYSRKTVSKKLEGFRSRARRKLGPQA